MKSYKIIYFILSLPLLWMGAFAYAQTWQEPPATPPDGNLLGPVWLMPNVPTNPLSTANQDGSIRLSNADGLAGVSADYAVLVSTSERVLNAFALDSGDWAGYFGNPAVATDEGDGNLFAKKYCLPDGPEDTDTDPDCITSWELIAQAGSLWTQETDTNNIFKGTADDTTGFVAIGTPTPSAAFLPDATGTRLYIDTANGNPEIDFGLTGAADATGNSVEDHWGIYADTATRQLRFWAKEAAATPTAQGRNNMALTSDGVMIFAGWGPLMPYISINDVSGLTDRSATLSGTVNPRGDTTTVWIRLYDTFTDTCSDTSGTKIPITINNPIATTNLNFSQSIGVVASKEYWFCALAENSSGLSVTDVKTFTALANTLLVTTDSATAAAQSATLNGTINPDGYASEAWFRYSTVPLQNDDLTDFIVGVSNCPANEINPASDALWGTKSTVITNSGTTTPFSASLSGLTGNTTYYYCAFAANTVSPNTKAAGIYKSFTTSSLPTATTNAATVLTTSGATLNGTFSAQGSTNVSLWFKYSTTNFAATGCVNATAANTTNLLSTSPITYTTIVSPYLFARSVTGLLGGTRYYYCALLTVGGVDYGGSIVAFDTTTSTPTVTTLAATNTSNTGATLNGTFNPNGFSSNAWLRWSSSIPSGCSVNAICINDTFGTKVGTTAFVSDVTAYSADITGLTANATYYFWAVAYNVYGTSYGILRSFIAAPAPVVSTLTTTVTSGSGTVTFRGSQTGATSAYFRYGVDSAACSALPSITGTLSNPTSTFSITRTLTCNRTYWVCAVGSNSNGTTYGNVTSFWLPDCSFTPG